MERHQSLQLLIIALASLALLSVCTANNSCPSQTTTTLERPDFFYTFLHHLDKSPYARNGDKERLTMEIRGVSNDPYVIIEFMPNTPEQTAKWGEIVELVALTMISLLGNAQDHHYYAHFNYQVPLTYSDPRVSHYPAFSSGALKSAVG